MELADLGPLAAPGDLLAEREQRDGQRQDSLIQNAGSGGARTHDRRIMSSLVSFPVHPWESIHASRRQCRQLWVALDVSGLYPSCYPRALVQMGACLSLTPKINGFGPEGRRAASSRAAELRDLTRARYARCSADR